jgi:predicted AAA+ superfamily ATPase
MITYITPQNVDQVMDQIRMPTWQELKDRKRPFTFFVEGIVGTGKSTLLQPFKVRKKVTIYFTSDQIRVKYTFFLNKTL